MNELKKYLISLIHFTESEMELFVSLFSEKQLNKNEYFANEGEYSTKFAFILTGVFRAFYRNNEGSEYNKTFFTNSNFVGAYSSLLTGNKNLINIQCLLNCTILEANYKSMVKLYDSTPKIERLSRILAEQYFVIKEKREIELVMLDASQRYELFKKEHPTLENKISQYHIASYLGVSPTQLSRIRAKK
ncbi:MAG: Crp/Fnr family transcriptional regulator [Bacteroidota bacterium]|nr:Crp/Fnr family transcriptional regulator [Bacteroidota bacterium]